MSLASALAVLCCAVTLPGTLELLLLTVGAWLPLRRRRGPGALNLVAVIPAHDEEGTVARAVASLRAGDPTLPVVVVADNCTDRTADRAREAGARVLVRTDPDRRGKPFALDFAFRILLSEPCDAIAVIDADSVVAPAFAARVREALGGGADAVQVPYGVLDPHASWRTTLLHVAFMAFNRLRPRGRAGWGLSVGLLGNGFALSRRVIEQQPLTTRSLTEDLHYHVELVLAGRRVELVPDVDVRAEMPAGGSGYRTQRARWEGGRLAVARSMAPRLAAGLVQGRTRCLEPLLELLTLPLAFHTLLLVGGCLLSQPGPTRAVTVCGLAVLGVHVATALVLGRAGPRDLLALLLAPAYVLWKLMQLSAILRASRRRADWVRTQRRPSG